jgi:hypothetical protein
MLHFHGLQLVKHTSVSMTQKLLLFRKIAALGKSVLSRVHVIAKRRDVHILKRNEEAGNFDGVR